MPDGPVIDTNLGPAPVAQANPVAQAGGPIGMLNDLAEMRNRQNANVLFTQQMAARHQLGEDLSVWGAQGLSPEEQISRASHQSYAPFVTPEIANFRSSNLAGAQVQEVQTHIEEAKQRMANAGLGPIAQALTIAQGDPAKLANAFKMATAGLPPELAKSLEPAFTAMANSVTTGANTGDKTQDSATIKQNLRNLGTTFGGLPLDKIYGMEGGVAPGFQTIKNAQGQEVPSVVAGTTATPVVGAASGTPIAGPTLTNAKYATDRGTDMAQYQTSLDDRVKTGQSIMQTLTPAWEALQEMKKAGQSPGGLQTARMGLAQIAQGLGASPEQVDRISRLGATQEFSKLMVNSTMAQITQQLPASSKLAVSEFNAFNKNNPNLDTDPRAIEKIFNFWSKVQGINRAEQAGMNDYLAKGGDISRWPQVWQEEAEKRGYVNPNPTGSGEGTKGASASRPPIESFFK